MKKKVLRKLRAMSEKILGEEKTNEIINKTVEKILEETKPKTKKKKESK